MTASLSAATWSLTGHRATCLLGGPPSVIDLDRPRSGIEIRRSGDRTADKLLGLDLDATFHCVDTWCRGGDVTAVYETGETDHLRATVMWRAPPPWSSPAATGGVWCREAVVSAQTSLLESVPRLSVVGEAACGDVVPVVVHGGRLARPPKPDLSPHGFFIAWPDDCALLFLIHPDDARAVELTTADDRVRVKARLFPASVEKGVLLRGRAMAAVGPVTAAERIPAWAETLAAAFAASPPVLTT